jgi:hypothetical protein
MPDLLTCLPAARALFIEMKRIGGGRLSPHQKDRIPELGALAFSVTIVRITLRQFWRRAAATPSSRCDSPFSNPATGIEKGEKFGRGRSRVASIQPPILRAVEPASRRVAGPTMLPFLVGISPLSRMQAC